jgi:hypothetical protein
VVVKNSDKALIIKLNKIFDEHKKKLKQKIDDRKIEIKSEVNAHWELYQLLGGFDKSESFNVDFYQNVGRFFFKYAGSMLEEMVIEIIKNKKKAEKIYIENTISTNPKKFEIDCFVKEDNRGHEIKWRDATTDGDHKKKEETKLKQLEKNNIIPVKIMFYMPEREQAKKIQTNIIKLYKVKGFSYVGDEAWKYITDYCGFNLRNFLFKQKIK